MKSTIRMLPTALALGLFAVALHTPISAETVPTTATTDKNPSNSNPVSPPATRGMSENQKCVMYSCVDTNSDNAVSTDELNSYGDASLEWNNVDTDHDGSISESEWDSRNSPPPPTGE